MKYDMPLNKDCPRVTLRFTKKQKQMYDMLGGADYVRKVLEEKINLYYQDEIIYQEGALVGSEDPYKLFRKVAEK